MPSQVKLTQLNMQSGTLQYWSGKYQLFLQRSRLVQIRLVQARVMSDINGPYLDVIFDTVSRRPVGGRPVSRVRPSPRGPFAKASGAGAAVDYGLRAKPQRAAARTGDIYRTVIHQYGNSVLKRQKFVPSAKTWVHCSCPWFAYVLEYALARHGSSVTLNCNGRAPILTNPRMLPGLCKHLHAIFERYVGSFHISKADPTTIKQVRYDKFNRELLQDINKLTDVSARRAEQKLDKDLKRAAVAAQSAKLVEAKLAEEEARLQEEEADLLDIGALLDKEWSDLLG